MNTSIVIPTRDCTISRRGGPGARSVSFGIRDAVLGASEEAKLPIEYRNTILETKLHVFDAMHGPKPLARGARGEDSVYSYAKQGISLDKGEEMVMRI